MTFAAYKIPDVAESLGVAVRRRVSIRFIAETAESSGGKLVTDAIAALGADTAAGATVYIWPRDKRSMNAAGNRGALHVKCAHADEDVLFISNANLTGAALEQNMELGVLIRGGGQPAQSANHIQELIKGGVLASELDAAVDGAEAFDEAFVVFADDDLAYFGVGLLAEKVGSTVK